MWIALLAFLYSPGPVAVLLSGIGVLLTSLRRRQWTGATTAGLAAVVLVLSGRWLVRLLRHVGSDEPQPLEPTRKGYATGRGGVQLEWEQFGPDDAPAILLSHGWALTHESWYYQKKALSDAGFRVLVWDMRGMGQSGAPKDQDYSMAALADDLAAVFDATEADRHAQGCVLGGHSIGAMILPLFADRFPERMARVRGLMMVAGTDMPLLATMHGRRWLLPLQPYFWEPLARLMGRCPLPFEAFARLIWQMGVIHLADMFGLHVGRESRGQVDLVASHCASVSMRAAGLGALSSFRFDARDASRRIGVPTLLLTGDCDLNMPPAIQKRMASRITDQELVVIPDCGHLCLLECHEQVSRILLKFAQRAMGGPADTAYG